MTKKSLYLVLSTVLLAVFVLFFLYRFGIVGNKENGKPVEVAPVSVQKVVETVSATGKIQPEIEVKISSEVSGEIIALNVKEGQLVKKGDLLVKINPDLYTSGFQRTQSNLAGTKANFQQAQASFTEAKANFDRSKILFEKGIISKQDWDKSIASFEVAKANKQAAYFTVQSATATVNEAKDNLGRTTIFAPADGTISMLNVELGERVLGTQQMAGTEILRVANLHNMEVEVDVNENDIVKIKVGNKANVEVDAYLKKQFEGVVTSISNSASATLSADQVTNFKVKVRILKKSYQDLVKGKPVDFSPFRPGMTATVDIITNTKNRALAVPISAVVVKSDTTAIKNNHKDEEKESTTTSKSDKKLECVFVKVKDKAIIRIVKTGIQDDTSIEIIKGVLKGDTIITGPFNTVSKELQSGDKIVLQERGNQK